MSLPASFLCFNISSLSSRLQFIICCLGVFFFFLLYGYFLELIFVFPDIREYGWYITFVQFCYYSIFGFIETRLRNDTQRKIPFRIYCFIALLTVGTMGFSNSTLGHLNYPTQVIFKCCKLIPVLVGSVLIQGKKHGSLDYVAAGLMVVGLILFTLADSKVSPVFDTIGLIMISTALLFDAIIGNVQEKEMKKYKASNAEVVLYSYSIGIIYVLLYLIISGDLYPALHISMENKSKVYGYGFVLSLSGYMGIQVVLQLVRTSGAFAAVTVTTCRKAVSIIISFLVFSKPFTSQYLYSGLLVVLGIYLNLYSKKHPDISCLELLKSFIAYVSHTLFKNYQVQKHTKFIQEV